MSAFQGSSDFSVLVGQGLSESGRASSISIVEPHFETAQSGASRSVVPERERRARRFFDERRTGDES